MSIHVYIYTYVHTYMYIYECTHIHTYIYTYIYIYIYIYIYMYIYIYIYTYLHIYIYTHIYIYIYTYIYIYIYIYMYMYIYINMSTYLHIYIYTCTQRQSHATIAKRVECHSTHSNAVLWWNMLHHTAIRCNTAVTQHPQQCRVYLAQESETTKHALFFSFFFFAPKVRQPDPRSSAGKTWVYVYVRFIESNLTAL